MKGIGPIRPAYRRARRAIRSPTLPWPGPRREGVEPETERVQKTDGESCPKAEEHTYYSAPQRHLTRRALVPSLLLRRA
jgi:hypothetical protein